MEGVPIGKYVAAEVETLVQVGEGGGPGAPVGIVLADEPSDLVGDELADSVGTGERWFTGRVPLFEQCRVLL